MQPKIYSSSQHHIRNDLIDPNALTVLETLHDAGYAAYLVGGGVRDLLMRKKPKDFDISTSAHPEEIKKLFRNCILIGRRFRLAHVRFGRQIIEVSTFRAGDSEEAELILRDNIWGSPEEDVLRRDFTINGLYYDPLDHKIIDYVGGFEDLQKHYLCVIGDPIVRFKQDPVRMIRMQKFRARFGFQVQPEALQALSQCRNEIIKSSPARVLEEIFRMLESGSSEPFFRLLAESKILEILFPKLDIFLHQEQIGKLIYSYLQAADSLNLQGRYPLDRSILAAALLFPVLEHHIKLKFPNKAPHISQIMEMTQDLIHEIFYEAVPHFPRKIRIGAYYVMHMQFRLVSVERKKNYRPRFAKHKQFIEALTFLKLRALVHPELFKNYEFWKRLWKKIRMEQEEKNG